jgi:cytochrome c oxidase subunit IV
MKQHIATIRTNILVFVALLALLLTTVGAANLSMGPLNFPVAMLIASAKAVLIVLFFMHALYSHRMTLVVSLAAVLWLGIMIALTLSDYASRG